MFLSVLVVTYRRLCTEKLSCAGMPPVIITGRIKTIGRFSERAFSPQWEADEVIEFTTAPRGPTSARKSQYDVLPVHAKCPFIPGSNKAARRRPNINYLYRSIDVAEYEQTMQL